ncbi:hypothetical protein [Chitinophaga sp. LS1]|nr:hypothetical protein [Chitinophaga sp. LS1]WPV65741.1 hypothetical protein QQL36_28475 [Chitinophaga sp. LS1]
MIRTLALFIICTFAQSCYQYTITLSPERVHVFLSVKGNQADSLAFN